MKKLVSISAAAIMLFSAVALAGDGDNVNGIVKSAFLTDFSTASNVSWEKKSGFYFATFTINSIEVNAAYNEEGELVGTSREMASTQLPISISLALAKKYEGYAVSKKALELTYEGETRYYVNVVNDRQALKLKCSVNGDIAVDRKIKRK